MKITVVNNDGTVARSSILPGQHFVVASTFANQGSSSNVFMAIGDADGELSRRGGGLPSPPPFWGVNVATGNISVGKADTRVYRVTAQGEPVTFQIQK